MWSRGQLWREPRFESQHLQWTVHPCLKLQLEEIQCHLLVSVGTECIWHMIQPEWEKMGFCQVIPVLLLLIPKILRGHDHPGTGCNGFMVILDYFLWETVPRQDPHRRCPGLVPNDIIKTMTKTNMKGKLFGLTFPKHTQFITEKNQSRNLKVGTAAEGGTPLTGLLFIAY
eukprot:XP_017445630.1 PREDICTED: uncharacterized protein LOC108348727 isoform X1 [Rattus norvegicus]